MASLISDGNFLPDVKSCELFNRPANLIADIGRHENLSFPLSTTAARSQESEYYGRGIEKKNREPKLQWEPKSAMKLAGFANLLSCDDGYRC